MKNLLLISFLFFFYLSYSQHIIVDEVSKSKISNVNISIKNTSKGFYSNKNGEFEINNFVKKGDTLVFTRIGYHKKERVFTNVNNFGKTELSKREENLKEINLKKVKKYKIEELGYKKRKILPTNSYTLGEIKAAVLIHNDSTKQHEGFIKELIFRRLSNKMQILKCDKNTNKCKIIIKYAQDVALKLQLYKLDKSTNLPNLNAPLIDREIIVKLDKKTKKLKYDISSLQIIMPREGVFLTLDAFGIYNDENKIVALPKGKNLINFGLTGKTNDESFTYFKYKDRKWSKVKTNALFSLTVSYPVY